MDIEEGKIEYKNNPYKRNPIAEANKKWIEGPPRKKKSQKDKHPFYIPAKYKYNEFY